MVPEEIRSVPFLEGLDPAVIQQHYIENNLRIRTYAKGATVHQLGEPCAGIDIVLSGGLAAYALSENGSAMTMFTFARHSVIGANLLFGSQSVYPLNIYCETACRLLRIAKPAVEAFLRDYSFAMRYIRSLSMHSQGMNRKITMMAQRTLRENLLDYLRRQSVAQGSQTVVLPISKKQLADHLGVQRPSLFRELKKLKDEGMIEGSNRIITLHDTPRT